MATTTRVLTASVNGTVYTTNANGALEAIDTCHSGATAPTNEVANGKLWLDTTTTPGILKMYNNAAWEVIGGSTSSPTFADGTFTGNVGIGTTSPDTLMELVGANPVLTIRDTDTGISTNDARLRLGESGASSSLDNYFDVGYVADTFTIGSNTVADALTIDRATGNVEVGNITATSTVTALNGTFTGDVTIGDDLFVTGPNPLITLTDNDAADEYTKLTNSDGATILGGRNGASNGIILFRGEGGGVNEEYARFNASANFGIGDTTPSEKLSVTGNIAATGNLSGVDGTFTGDVNIGDDLFLTGPTPTITLTDNDVADEYTKLYSNGGSTVLGSRNGADNGSIIFRGEGGGVGDEYARFTAAGHALVGKTAAGVSSDGVELNGSDYVAATRDAATALYLNRRTSDGTIAEFRKDNTTVGSVAVTASATTYNTSSDYRLKENITPIQGAADTVMAMQPCTYTAIVDGLWYDGFLAHELQEVHPRAVQGTKDAMMDEEYEVTPDVYEDVVTPAVDAVAATYDDEGIELTPAVEAAPETTENTLVTEAVMGTRSVPDMQSVDYSKLTPILTAALQEALAKIEAMEVRLSALEI